MKKFILYLLFSFLFVINALAKSSESDSDSSYKNTSFLKGKTFTIGTGIHYYHDEDLKDAMVSIMPLNFNFGYLIDSASFVDFEYVVHAKDLSGYAVEDFIQRFHSIRVEYRYIPFTFKSQKVRALIIGPSFQFMKIKTNYLPGGNVKQSDVSVDAGFLFGIYDNILLEALYSFPVIYFNDTGKPIRIKNARDSSGFSILLKYKFN